MERIKHPYCSVRGMQGALALLQTGEFTVVNSRIVEQLELVSHGNEDKLMHGLEALNFVDPLGRVTNSGNLLQEKESYHPTLSKAVRNLYGRDIIKSFVGTGSYRTALDFFTTDCGMTGYDGEKAARLFRYLCLEAGIVKTLNQRVGRLPEFQLPPIFQLFQMIRNRDIPEEDIMARIRVMRDQVPILKP